MAPTRSSLPAPAASSVRYGAETADYGEANADARLTIARVPVGACRRSHH